MDPVVGKSREQVAGFIAEAELLFPIPGDLTDPVFADLPHRQEPVSWPDVIGPDAFERCDGDCSISAGRDDRGLFPFARDPVSVVAQYVSEAALPNGPVQGELRDLLMRGWNQGFTESPQRFEHVLEECVRIINEPFAYNFFVTQSGLDSARFLEMRLQLAQFADKNLERREQKAADKKFNYLECILIERAIFGHDRQAASEIAKRLVQNWRELGVTRSNSSFMRFDEQADTVLGLCAKIEVCEDKLKRCSKSEDRGEIEGEIRDSKRLVRSFISEVVFNHPFVVAQDNMRSFAAQVRERALNSFGTEDFKENVDLWLKHSREFDHADIKCLIELAVKTDSGTGCYAAPYAKSNGKGSGDGNGNGKHLADGKLIVGGSKALSQGPIIDYFKIVGMGHDTNEHVQRLWFEVSGQEPEKSSHAQEWILSDRAPGLKMTTVIEAACAKLGIAAKVKIEGDIHSSTWQLSYAWL